MKIAVLIPDRNDREKLLNNCIRMMQNQTLQPVHIEIVNHPPANDEKDITLRYKTGYDRLRNRGLDLIAFIENDDWYDPTYLEKMVAAWELAGQPDLFGTDQTIYYHLKLKRWFIMEHPIRSSAMNTFIKPDLQFTWCQNNDPYTDLHLWLHSGLQGKIIHMPTISIGMKHMVGKHGGKNHTDHLDRYINNDSDLGFLKEKLDPDSFNFYSTYYR